MANNAKGKPNATPNPAIPADNCIAPPFMAPTSNVPNKGPVQEKDTMVKVTAIKKMPPILLSPLLESAFPAIEPGKVISKKPKKEIANTINMIKKIMFKVGLVDMLFNISGLISSRWKGKLAAR